VRLDGQVAIVTGGSRGIGEAIATAFVEAGAQVVIASRKQPELEAAAARISATGGGDVLAGACHTGKPEQIDALVEQAIEQFGQIDILVNNAATNPYFGPLLEVEQRAWDKTFEVNLQGYLQLSRAVAKHLVEWGTPGAIINIASILGVLGAPAQGVYAMTKAAVISMTKTLAMELGPSQIRVNAIAPGYVRTRLAQTLTDDEAFSEGYLARTPLGRFGEPDDIAGAALFLASDAASYITGQTLIIDGGYTLG